MSHGGYAVHEGVSCDGCGHTNFNGNRYKCLRCIDFDLCHQCFTQKRFSSTPQAPDHQDTHPMQMILTARDFEIIYDGDSSKNYEVCKIGSFTCPICNLCGLNLRTFANHVAIHPVSPELKILCPLCIAFPGDSNAQYTDLKDHITNVHSHLDSTYRNEPPVRATSRRPMLARRTQRQPAGQAGTFAQQTLGISLGPLGWPSEEVEEMFRMAQMNRQNPPINVMATAANVQGVVHMGGGHTISAENHQAVLQSLQREQVGLQRAVNSFISGQMTRGGAAPAASSRQHSEYAQPRQTAARQPQVNQPIARLTRTTPIFPVSRTDEDNNVSSDDAADLTGDENEYCSGEEEVPPLENDSLDGDVASTSAEAGSSDYTALLSTADSREPSIKKPSIASAETVSEFEFDVDEEDNSTEESDAEFVESETTERKGGVESVDMTVPRAIPTEREIISSLRKNTTEAEFRQLMKGIQDDTESDDEEELPTDPNMDLGGRESGDSLEEQLGKLVYATVQFDVPPLNTFGSTDNWNDKRYLRHRKLHRELSTASTMEDTLEKTDVALSFVQVAAGGNSDRCRVLDKSERSVRRSLADLKLSEQPVRMRQESPLLNLPTTSAASAPVDSKQDLAPKETNGVVNEDEPVKQNAGTVKFQPSVDEAPSPTDGESSEDEEERSFRQDDVQFLEESELRQ